MAKRKSWPFRNSQAISKPCKGIKTAVAVSKRPKVLKRQVTYLHGWFHFYPCTAEIRGILFWSHMDKVVKAKLKYEFL